MKRSDLRLRNAFWLRLYEGRQPDPITGKLRPMSIAEIARLAEKSEQTVRDGIAAARGWLKELDDAVECTQPEPLLYRA